MLHNFLVVGYDEQTFWTLTVRRYKLYMEAAQERMIHEANEGRQQAWLAGITSASSKPVKLEKFLIDTKKIKTDKTRKQVRRTDSDIKADLAWMRHRLNLPKKSRQEKLDRLNIAKEPE